jgi:Spx/MgsR family transcriptional regulator
MTTLYGIAHCDTVKKSRAWLDAQAMAYQFHDFKKLGVPAQALDHWEALVNKKGTTWRTLDAAQQAAVVNAASAKALMLREPSVIKRPVVIQGARVSVGFSPDAWALG